MSRAAELVSAFSLYMTRMEEFLTTLDLCEVELDRHLDLEQELDEEFVVAKIDEALKLLPEFEEPRG